MSGLENWSWAYDGWIVLAGMLCAVAASLPGNFLLLRQGNWSNVTSCQQLVPPLDTGRSMRTWLS